MGLESVMKIRPTPILAAVLATVVGSAHGSIRSEVEETGRRVLIRLSPDTVVHVDSEGGRWLVPEPSRRRITMVDMFTARILHDEFEVAGLQSLEPLLSSPAARADLAREIGLDRWVVATFPSSTLASDAAARLTGIGGPIEAIELDGLGGVAASPPDDSWFTQQYGLRNTGQNIAGVDGIAGADVNVLPAWDWTTGSDQTVVAVLDAGMSGHEEFADRLTPGWNVPDGTDSFDDECSSHGTHVTGIIAAEGDNGQGIAGIDWRCSIMPVVVVDGCTGFESWVAEGIVWAVDHGADIINMSLQYGAGTQALADAVAYADAAGVIQIAAAGNTGGIDDVQAPARFPETIAVAATDNRDQRWSSSSGGPEIDLAAPGWRIYSSAATSNYVSKSGTSMASPFVCGTVSLMKAVDPDLDPETARQILRATAEDVESAGRDDLTGFGRLDVNAAILALDPTPPAAGDLDRDGRVDGQDFGLVLSGWGPCPGDCEDVCPADLNGDCTVDGSDLGMLLLDWTG